MGTANAVEAILYLPMFSLGMAAHGMEARIEYLKAKTAGRDLAFFAESALEALEAICDERYRGNARFGDFFIRLYEIRRRAKMILEIGIEHVEATLARPSAFPTAPEFKRTLKFLTKFRGISETAAQHILMDLGWPIIKPDRHIQRILYRMGGWNEFFDSEDGDKKLTPGEWYEFQKKWAKVVADIVSHDYGAAAANGLAGVPTLNQLNSRQIDITLMWFSQTQKRDDGTLKPPLCTADPKCQSCAVPECTQRRMPKVM